MIKKKIDAHGKVFLIDFLLPVALMPRKKTILQLEVRMYSDEYCMIAIMLDKLSNTICMINFMKKSVLFVK